MTLEIGHPMRVRAPMLIGRWMNNLANNSALVAYVGQALAKLGS
jgi:hypothetical protein